MTRWPFILLAAAPIAATTAFAQQGPNICDRQRDFWATNAFSLSDQLNNLSKQLNEAQARVKDLETKLPKPETVPPEAK